MKWFAWMSEYPDDGSIVIEASSRDEAIRCAAADLDCSLQEITVTPTPSRAEILSLLRAAEDALRYKKALETVVSIGNGKADGLTVIQMWNEARAALAPKEENRG